MEIYNLESSERYKTQGYITQNMGGNYSFKESFKNGGKGISGLTYFDGIFTKYEDSDTPTIATTIEQYKNGLGLYLRSRHANQLLLIPFEEIESIDLIKKNDLVLPTQKSIFLKLLKYKVPYHLAKIFILEREEVELNDYKVFINLKQTTSITLVISRLNPYKVINFIQTQIEQIPVKTKIESYTLLDQNHHFTDNLTNEKT